MKATWFSSLCTCQLSGRYTTRWWSWWNTDDDIISIFIKFTVNHVIQQQVSLIEKGQDKIVVEKAYVFNKKILPYLCIQIIVILIVIYHEAVFWINIRRDLELAWE